MGLIFSHLIVGGLRVIIILRHLDLKRNFWPLIVSSISRVLALDDAAVDVGVGVAVGVGVSIGIGTGTLFLVLPRLQTNAGFHLLLACVTAAPGHFSIFTALILTATELHFLHFAISCNFLKIIKL